MNACVWEYIHKNTNFKRKPNMTSVNFSRWVNDELLPNVALEPGFPRRISLATARKWFH